MVSRVMLVHLQLRKNRTIFGDTAVAVCCKRGLIGQLLSTVLEVATKHSVCKVSVCDEFLG